ncbi:4'-phosphopantetheinyl transferase family protein [Cellulomonas sp. NPDC057328]|uniref:4'-phosphopantetheinyl transferase family protein n=1 Tax=Cellulomonas sp. NPDC057328 TaxID=3346101 RepID=UPI003641D77E
MPHRRRSRPPRPHVDVWWTPPLDVPDAAFLPVLDPAERARHGALPVPLRTPFVQARALLRVAVGRRSGVAPAAVGLAARCPACAGDHGPVTVTVPAAPPLHVSLTRSGPLLAVAVTEAGPVGVDVVACDDVAAAPLADVALGPRERARHDRLPADARTAALARAWARTEAVLKARRTGLRTDPADVDVRRDRVRVPGSRTPVRVRDLPLGAGVVGAVAVDAPPGRGRPGDRLRAAGRGGMTVSVHDGSALLAGCAPR